MLHALNVEKWRHQADESKAVVQNLKTKNVPSFKQR